MGCLRELSYSVFYSSLAFTAFSILFYGPITNIYKDETVFSENLQILNGKGPLILLCQKISVECPTNLNFPLLTSNENKGSLKQQISMKGGSKFVGHSTEIIRQSKIKGPLKVDTMNHKL